eukprot:s6_g43.t1
MFKEGDLQVRRGAKAASVSTRTMQGRRGRKQLKGRKGAKAAAFFFFEPQGRKGRKHQQRKGAEAASAFSRTVQGREGREHIQASSNIHTRSLSLLPKKVQGRRGRKHLLRGNEERDFQLEKAMSAVVPNGGDAAPEQSGTCKEIVQASERSSGAEQQSGAAEHRSNGVCQDLQGDRASIGAEQRSIGATAFASSDLQGDRTSIGAEQRSIGATAIARTCKEIVQASERSSGASEHRSNGDCQDLPGDIAQASERSS